jgi:predicted transcriptional regulator
MQLGFLDSLGLSHKEIKIYETLLKKGEMLPGALIKTLDLKRATVYKALYALEEKGLIQQRKTNEKTTFVPESPEILLNRMEAKMDEDKRALDALKEVLPQMMNSSMFTLEKPEITMYSGVEGLKAIYMDTLNGGFLRLSATADNVDIEFLTWIVSYYVPESIKRGLGAKMLMADAPWVRQYQEMGIDELSEMIIVPREKMTVEHSVGIFRDKVAFINYGDNDSLIGIVIRHPLMAKTMADWFDITWEAAKRLGFEENRG